MDVDIGRRLRFLREAHGLSQRELAKRASITNSTISLIESNRTNPSVGALQRILAVFPIGLADFFNLEPPSDPSIFFTSDNFSKVGKVGRLGYRRLGHSIVDDALQIFLERYEPGGDSGQIMLTHEGEEGGVIISGRLLVTVDDQKRALGPLEAYYFDARRQHRFHCLGQEPCHVLTVLYEPGRRGPPTKRQRPHSVGGTTPRSASRVISS